MWELGFELTPSVFPRECRGPTFDLLLADLTLWFYLGFAVMVDAADLVASSNASLSLREQGTYTIAAVGFNLCTRTLILGYVTIVTAIFAVSHTIHQLRASSGKAALEWDANFTLSDEALQANNCRTIDIEEPQALLGLRGTPEVVLNVYGRDSEGSQVV